MAALTCIMNRIFLFTISILLGYASFAQKIQFINPSNHWGFRDSTTGCCIPIRTDYSTDFYDSTAAVTYNGHNYQYLQTSVQSFLVREDSGRVYVIGTDDSTERVLYDFNVGLGDTMVAIYPGDTLISWVTEMDSTQFGGIWYKTWHFEGLDHSVAFDTARTWSYNVIEEFGCTNGLYYPASPYSLALFSEQMLCFTNNMNISSALSKPVPAYGDVFTSYYDNSTSCNEFNHPPVYPTEGVSQAHGVDNVIIAPDPINENSRIIFPHNISGNITVMNLQGQTVINISFRNQKEMQIDRIQMPGIYYYRVTDDINKKVYSGKLSK